MVTNNSTGMGSPYVAPGLPSGGNTLTNPNTGGRGNLLNADTNPDELAQLLPLILKKSIYDAGVPFPGILFTEEQTNALAVHTYPNLPSARVENMGRNPGIFTVKAILTNNIYPGTNETWKSGQLFPNTFIALTNLLVDPNNKVLQHPIYGLMTVQVHGWSYELNPKGPRDGVILTMHFIETIGDNNPLSQQLAPPPGASLAQSAIALDNSIASTTSSINLPININQLFGNVANTINQAISTPNDIIDSIGSTISFSQVFGRISSTINHIASIPNNAINTLSNIVNATIVGGSSIAGALIRAPAFTVNNTLQAIQSTKNSVLNSTVENAINYDESTYQAVQNILSLNSTPSQNAFQLMNKTMTALVTLQQHYINQNNAAAMPIIEAIRQMLLQVQQLQSALSLNTNNQGIAVATYITQNDMTWMQLARLLNNGIDDLLGLNQGLIDDVWVPANTTISYFQSTTSISYFQA